jgi:DNA-binding beta-propeller fold protein YncE
MAHPGASTVDVFSLVKRRLVVQLGDMKGPSGIAVDEQGGRVFVANSDGHEIAVIGTKDWQVQRRIPLKSSPGALLFVPELNALYASNWRDQSISLVDLRQDAVRDAIGVGGRPESLVYDPVEKHILASLEDVRRVAVLDPSLKLIKSFSLAASLPTGLALDGRARRLYVAVRHAVISLDLDSGQELGRLAAPDGIDMLWLDNQSGNLYGAAVGGSVMLIKAGQGQFSTAKEYETEVRGHSLAFDPAKQMLYLPGGRDGRSKLLILRHLTPGEAANTKPQIARK